MFPRTINAPSISTETKKVINKVEELNTPSQSVMDMVLPVMLQAVEEWKNHHNPEALKETVFKKLNDHRDTLILQLLGFDNRWSRIEIDNCNGRAKNTIIGEYLKKHQEEAINEWLQKVALPVLTEKQRKEMQKAMNDWFIREFNRRLQDLAVERAQKEAVDMLEKLSSVSDLEKLRQAFLLVNQNSEA